MVPAVGASEEVVSSAENAGITGSDAFLVIAGFDGAGFASTGFVSETEGTGRGTRRGNKLSAVAFVELGAFVATRAANASAEA